MNLSKMSLQAIFNKVTKHLIKQGRPAASSSSPGYCRYRMPRSGRPDLTCAVGCLISKKDWSPHIEGLPVDNPNVAGLLGLAVSMTDPIVENVGKKLDLLLRLQSVHDDTHLLTSKGTFNMKDLKVQLRAVAEHCNLTVPFK